MGWQNHASPLFPRTGAVNASNHPVFHPNGLIQPAARRPQYGWSFPDTSPYPREIPVAESNGHVASLHPPPSQPLPPVCRPISGMLFATELLDLSFDALAQIDAASGVLLWCNSLFTELMSIVGGGDPGIGLSIFRNCGMPNSAYEPQLRRVSLGSGTSMMDLWCATRTCWDETGQGVVLCAVRQSHPSMRGMSADGENLDGTPQDPSLSAAVDTHEAEQTEGFPFAGDFPDPESRIETNSELAQELGGSYSGRGRRPSMMLWRRYGRKPVIKSDGGQLTK